MFTKISTSKIIKIIRKSIYGIGIIFFIIGLVFSIFLYNNIYQTIIQSEEIVVLQGQLALEPVDISLFRNILSKIEEKKIGVAINLEDIKNPFSEYDSENEKE